MCAGAICQLDNHVLISRHDLKLDIDESAAIRSKKPSGVEANTVKESRSILDSRHI